MSTASRKNPEIERLRGIAVILTILTHIHPENIPEQLFRAWGGVDLFFVISGYVITNSLLSSLPTWSKDSSFLERLESSRIALRIFFTKRFYRIIPLAAIVALMTFSANWLFGDPNGRKFLVKESIGLLSGFYNYTLAAHLHGSDHYGVYWSLAVEEHFYILFPFILILANTIELRLIWTLGIIAIIACLIRPISTAGTNISDWTEWRAATHLRADALLAGVAISLFRSRGWGTSFAKKSTSVNLIVFTSICGVWLVPTICTGANAKVAPAVLISLWSMSAVLVFLSSFQRGLVFEFYGIRRLLEYSGSRSYALYLSHALTFRVFENLQSKIAAKWAPSIDLKTSTLSGTALLIVIIAVAETLHRIIEIPFIRRGAARSQAIATNSESESELK